MVHVAIDDAGIAAGDMSSTDQEWATDHEHPPCGRRPDRARPHPGAAPDHPAFPRPRDWGHAGQDGFQAGRQFARFVFQHHLENQAGGGPQGGVPPAEKAKGRGRGRKGKPLG